MVTTHKISVNIFTTMRSWNFKLFVIIIVVKIDLSVSISIRVCILQNPISFVSVPAGYVVSWLFVLFAQFFEHHLFSFYNLSFVLISEIMAQEILSTLQVKQEWHWTTGGVW
jgi:hypothetical protein